MPIPDFQTLMRPILAFLADGEAKRTRDIISAMSDQFRLTGDERTETLPSGRRRRINNRVEWALTYLQKAGLVEKSGYGLRAITPAGLDALSMHPDRIDTRVLETYPAFLQFRPRRRSHRDELEAEGGSSDEPPSITEDDDETPNELAERAGQINRAAMENNVLEAALKLTPTGFEELVVRLLEKMEYGQAGSILRTPPSGDGGVDGIISRDRLGLDRIYVQAKRYAPDKAIDAPLINGFAGALSAKQGERGLFITTSRFTQGAREQAAKIAARIVLIDGKELAALMVDHGVGVEVEQTVTLYRLDEEFFDTIL